MSARQAGEAIGRGLHRSGKLVEVRVLPMADGGEGTLACFLDRGATPVECRVHDPLMRPVVARYALHTDRQTAYVEMAEASGLMRLQPHEFNPLRTTSLGTGELIRDAVMRGARNIILGIGGSATSDGGTGMMAALGARMLDNSGNEVFPCGGSLHRMEKIHDRPVMGELRKTTFTALRDVSNPFYGEHGAAWVYAPQKGASPEDVLLLDAGLRHLAALIQRSTGINLQEMPGTGAGGGLAGAAVAWLGAKLRPGIDVIMELVEFEQALSWADVVITGEGKVDRQTQGGKVVDGVIRRATHAGKKVVVVCGQSVSGINWPAVTIHAMTAFAGVAQSLSHPEETLEKLVESAVAPDLGSS